MQASLWKKNTVLNCVLGKNKLAPKFSHLYIFFLSQDWYIWLWLYFERKWCTDLILFFVTKQHCKFGLIRNKEIDEVSGLRITIPLNYWWGNSYQNCNFLKAVSFKVSDEFADLPVLSPSLSHLSLSSLSFFPQGFLSTGVCVYRVILSQSLNSDKRERKGTVNSILSYLL